MTLKFNTKMITILKIKGKNWWFTHVNDNHDFKLQDKYGWYDSFVCSKCGLEALHVRSHIEKIHYYTAGHHHYTCREFRLKNLIG